MVWAGWKARLTKTLPTPPNDSIQTLGARRRRAPKKSSENRSALGRYSVRYDSGDMHSYSEESAAKLQLVKLARPAGVTVEFRTVHNYTGHNYIAITI